MAFESIPLGWVTAGKAGLQKLFRRIKDNFDSLNGSVTTLEAGNIVNASFDVDSDFNDSPDNWALALYAGGQPGLSPSEVKGTDDGSYRCKAGHTSDSTNRPVTGENWATYWEEKGAGETAWATGRPYRTANAHGGRCLYFVHPGGAGNGGGNAESDYFPVSEYRDVNVSLTHWADNAAVHDKAEALYYDRDKLYLSAATLFDNSGGNPTTPTRTACNLTPPSGARFVKVKLYGGVDDVNPGAEVTSYFDDVRVTSIEDGAVTGERISKVTTNGSYSIPASNSWTPTTGLYQITAGEGGSMTQHLLLQFWDNGWKPSGGGNAPAGMVISNNGNVRVYNNDGDYAHTVYYQTI